MKIFISYRRIDSAPEANLLDEFLSSEFWSRNVTLDVKSFGGGDKFDASIVRAVSNSNIVLVLIGQKWADDHGLARLHDPTDRVRQEIELALANNIPTYPVLVGPDQEMPELQKLPASIQPLFSFSAIQLATNERLPADKQALLRAICKLETTWQHLCHLLFRPLYCKLYAAALVVLVATYCLMHFDLLTKNVTLQLDSDTDISGDVDIILTQGERQFKTTAHNGTAQLSVPWSLREVDKIQVLIDDLSVRNHRPFRFESDGNLKIVLRSGDDPKTIPTWELIEKLLPEINSLGTIVPMPENFKFLRRNNSRHDLILYAAEPRSRFIHTFRFAPKAEFTEFEGFDRQSGGWYGFLVYDLTTEEFVPLGCWQIFAQSEPRLLVGLNAKQKIAAETGNDGYYLHLPSKKNSP